MLLQIDDTLAIDPKQIVDISYDDGNVKINYNSSLNSNVGGWLLHNKSKKFYKALVKRVNRTLFDIDNNSAKYVR